MQHQSTPAAQRNARILRSDATASEWALWRALRGGQLGAKFRRQHPFGNYIADFACLEPKLIIELDGSQHLDQAAYDAKRDAYFQAHGFDVLRFPSDAPFKNLEGVLTVMAQQLAARAPTPTLPQRGAPTPTLPQRGREEEDRN